MTFLSSGATRSKPSFMCSRSRLAQTYSRRVSGKRLEEYPLNRPGAEYGAILALEFTRRQHAAEILGVGRLILSCDELGEHRSGVFQLRDRQRRVGSLLEDHLQADGKAVAVGAKPQFDMLCSPQGVCESAGTSRHGRLAFDDACRDPCP